MTEQTQNTSNPHSQDPSDLQLLDLYESNPINWMQVNSEIDNIINLEGVESKDADPSHHLSQAISQEKINFRKLLVDQRASIEEILIPEFIEEADAIIEDIRFEWHKIKALESQPKEDDLSIIKRSLHTLKGSVGMIGALSFWTEVHNTESEIEDSVLESTDWPSQKLKINQLIINIREWIQWIKDADYIPQINQSLQTHQTATPNGLLDSKKETTQADQMQADAALPQESNIYTAETVKIKVKNAETILADVGLWGGGQMAFQKQNNRLKTIIRSLEDNSDHISLLLKEVEVSAEAQMLARKDEKKNMGETFDPLEMDRFTRLQESTRIIAEGMNDLSELKNEIENVIKQNDYILMIQSRGIKSVQSALSEVRLVSLDAALGRFKKTVALSVKESKNKKATLKMMTGNTKFDRGVFEKIVAPLEHILRNAVAHGIETAEKRIEANKPEIGQIDIVVSSETGFITIQVRDDGSGLQFDKIKERAISLGLIDQSAVLDRNETAKLIFRPGFSTADEITKLAGRGVGMDVVKNEVEKIGGVVSIRSQEGLGTSITLKVPSSISVAQSLIVKNGSEIWAIPSQMILNVFSLEKSLVEEMYKTGHKEGIPFFALKDLLSPNKVSQKIEKFNSVIEVGQGDEKALIHVEKMLSVEDATLRPLSTPLNTINGFSGLACLQDGQLAILLHPIPMVHQKQEVSVRKEQSTKQKTLTAFVVDDSIVVRKVTSGLLKNNGIEVVLAKDGIDALEKFQSFTPDILLVDLEMPRMNGFELVKNIKTNPKLSHIPVIMITSRTAEKHQDEAKNIGIDLYLGKPYQEDELITAIHRLVEIKKHQVH